MEFTTTNPETLKSLFNLHLKNHPSFEDGMLFDEVNIVNGKVVIHADFHYGGKLPYQEIERVYSDTVKGFGL